MVLQSREKQFRELEAEGLFVKGTGTPHVEPPYSPDISTLLWLKPGISLPKMKKEINMPLEAGTSF